MDPFIITYIPLSPNGPLREHGKFTLIPEIPALAWKGKAYDPADPAAMREMVDDQAELMGFTRFSYDAKRIRVLPISVLVEKRQTQLASEAETLRIVAQNQEESRRLAEIAASAPAPVEAPHPPHIDPPDDEDDEPPMEAAPAFPDSSDDGDAPHQIDEPAADEVPPYPEWPDDELAAEVKQRKLKLPKGTPKNDRAALIAALEADDAADGAA